MIRLQFLNAAKWKFLLAIGLVISAALFNTTAGLAHANLLRSDPADSTVLEETPKEILMWFDEPVSARFSSAKLYDADSQLIEITGIRSDPSDSTLLVLIIPELPPGVYSVLWKVLSEVDGHYSQGLLVLGIGEGVDLGTAAIAPIDDPAPPVPEVILRWFNLLMLVGFIGGIAMSLLVLSPARVNSKYGTGYGMIFRDATRRVLMLASWCAGSAIVAGLGLLLWQTVILKESLPEGISFLNAAEQVLTQTRWGKIWLIRQVILACAGTCVFYILQKENRSNPGKITIWTQPVWLMVITFCQILIVLQALSSHAAGLITNTTLAIVSDGLHLLGASLWVGGLLSLVASLVPLIRSHRGEIGDLVRAGWRPFSKVAALSVALLFATGFYNTGRQVASLDALFTTVYGQALIGKISLMLGVGLIGLINASLLHPRLSAPIAKLLGRPAGWTPFPLRRFPRLVVMEGSLGLLVLLITGVITASAAPRDSSFTVDPEDVANALSQNVDDLVITLSAKPNRPGQNVFTVFTSSTRRPPPAEIARVILRFEYQEQDTGRVTAITEEVGRDRYLVGGNFINLAGRWSIEVVVRRLGMEDSVAQFDWVVSPPGGTRPAIISKAPLEMYLTYAGAATILLSLIGVLMIRSGMNWRSSIRHFMNKRKPWIETPFTTDENKNLQGTNSATELHQ